MGKLFKKRIKPGDIVINHKNPDAKAASHPLMQISENDALIMTTKEFPSDGAKTHEIAPSEVDHMDVHTKMYVTNNMVDNNQGHIIGKVKKNRLNRVIAWFLKNDNDE